MKKYQLFVFVLALLILLSFAGCRQQIATAPTETQGAESSVTTMGTTESTPTEPVWMGYESPKVDYVYYYDSGRPRDWEEDILYFANSLMTEHPMMLNENWIVRLPNYGSTGDNFYDPQVKEAVLQQINSLIPMLETLSDEQIQDHILRITALFRDVHTRLQAYASDYFPIAFQPIYEDDSWVFYAVILEAEYEALLYSRLTAINGYPIQQVIDQIRPFVPCETEWTLINCLAGGGYSSAEYLVAVRILKAAGIMEETDTQAIYTLMDGDGQCHDICVTAAKSFPQDRVGIWATEVYAVPYTDSDARNYWMTEDLAENTLYVRFNAFRVQQDYTYLQLSSDIRRAYQAHGSYDKVIVDLRFNGGGNLHSGYEGLISLFKRMECEEFYVLINGSSYSQAIIFAAELMTARGENALLVGEPSGEAAGFFAGIWRGTYIMPNCQMEFTIPTEYFRMFPMDHGGAILPDLLVYQTIADYRQGIDTVLEYVLNQ